MLEIGKCGTLECHGQLPVGGEKMKKMWRRMKEKSGQSLVEYALILALVAIVVITALTALGGKAATTMNNVAGSLP